MRRDADRRVPLEAVAEVLGLLADRHLRPRHHLLLVLDFAVVATNGAAVTAAVCDVRVARVDRYRRRLAARRRVPVTPRDAARRAARNGHRRVVLLAAVEPEGCLVVQRQAVDLRGRLVLLGRPGAAAVEADVGAAVVALNEIQRIVGVDPQGVVVTVRDADRPEARAAVDRTPEHHVQDVDRVGVLRVGLEVGVVPRPLAQLAVGGHQPELLAAVVGTEEASLVVLDQGPDPVRGRRRNGHRDAALDALG